MFATIFDAFALLLVLAAVIGYVNHRFIELPFAIGIMVGGLVASMVLLVAESALGFELTAIVRDELMKDLDFTEVLMHGMLSFLLFAGALHTDLDRLKRWAAAIGLLASVGVMISTTIIGFGSYYFFGAIGYEIPLIYCFVFGAIVTPTDPVAVLGIMRAAGAPKDVEIKVVGESLFNDGVGVVLFTVLLAVATGGGAHGEMSVTGVAELIAIEVIGGIGLGLLGGYLTYLAMRSLDEPNLETLITVALVMGLTFVAFKVHASAPLACVVAGLFMGNRGRDQAMSDETERSVDIVWNFIDEALNAALFLLIGIEFIAVPFEWGYAWAAAGAVVLALAARAVSVYVPIQGLNTKLNFREGTKRVLWWGGIKGGISVALVLSVPPFEGRELLVAVTYGIVVVSVLVQGLTIGKVIERLFPDTAGAPAAH